MPLLLRFLGWRGAVESSLGSPQRARMPGVLNDAALRWRLTALAGGRRMMRDEIERAALATVGVVVVFMLTLCALCLWA